MELVFLGTAFLGILIATTTWNAPQMRHPQIAGSDAGVDSSLSGAELRTRHTLLVLALFLLSSGVVGYGLSRFAKAETFLVLPTAVAAGVLGASLAERLPVTQDDDPAPKSLAGTVGRLTLPIREGGQGEMVYSRGRRVRHVPAASHDGLPISKGEAVIVVSQDSDFVVVRRLDSLLQVVESAIGR